MEKDQIDINTICETFKRKLKAAIDENIPSKIFKKNKNLDDKEFKENGEEESKTV